MAGDLDFKVNADTSGARRSLQSLESSLASVTSAFQGVIAAVGITSIVKFNDSVTDLTNKLRILDKSLGGSLNQFNAVAAIAIGARSDLAATGDLYFRIARSADQLGISQQEAATITDSLAKAMTASGLSAQEAAGPLLQLGQALQSGKFQGDELRSILEGMPIVARALADELGVPIGALKELGAQGKITGDTFVNAMRRARDSIVTDFASTVPTVSQAFNVLQTEIAKLFSNFESQTQAGATLSKSILLLSFELSKLGTNISEIIGPLGTFLKIILSLAAVTVVGKALKIITGLFAAAGAAVTGTAGAVTSLSTTFGILFNNIKKIISGFIPLGKIPEVLGRRFGFLGKGIALLLKSVGALGAGIATFFGLDKLGEQLESLKDPASEASQSLEEYMKKQDEALAKLSSQAPPKPPVYVDPDALKKALSQVDKITIGYQRQLGDAEKRLRFEQELIGLTESERAVKEALFNLESEYLNTVNQLVDEYAEKSKSSKEEDKKALPEIQKRIQTVSEAYSKQIGVVKQITEGTVKRLNVEKELQGLLDFTATQTFGSQKKIRDLQHEINSSTLTTMEKKYADIKYAADEVARAEIDRINNERRRRGEVTLSTSEEQKYYDAAKKNIDDIMAKEKERYDESRKWSTGWKNAFDDYIENATNAAKAAESIFQKATQGMEDAIVNFAKTGKFEFRSFVNSILEEMLRANIRQLFAGGLAGGGGGFFSGLGKLMGFAGGGVIPTNAPVIVGERGPELLMGAAGNRVVPNNALGGNVVTYNINAVDAMSFKQMLAQDPSFLYAVTEQGRRTLPQTRR